MQPPACGDEGSRRRRDTGMRVSAHYERGEGLPARGRLDASPPSRRVQIDQDTKRGKGLPVRDCFDASTPSRRVQIDQDTIRMLVDAISSGALSGILRNVYVPSPLHHNPMLRAVCHKHGVTLYASSSRQYADADLGTRDPVQSPWASRYLETCLLPR